MAEERLLTSENATESRPDGHKGSGFAVPDARWYIAECKPTRERTVREILKKTGYEVYVASQKEKHRYKSGNIRTVEHVILPGRVFVHTAETNLVSILTAFSSVYRFQINRAAAVGPYGGKPFAYVPADDMERLMTLLDKAESPVHITDVKFHLDQEVKVVSGPLAGISGRFCRKGSATYIVIKVALGTTHYVYSEVSVNDVQPVT